MTSAPADDRRAARIGFTWTLLWFAANSLQKPLQSEFGLVQGFDNLPALMITSVAIVLPLNLLFSRLAARMSSRRLIPIVGRAFVAAQALFIALFAFAAHGNDTWLARAYYLWMGVYSLASVSLFWGAMTERFDGERAKALFGRIIAGSSLGTAIGSGIASGVTWLASGPKLIDTRQVTLILLTIAALLIEIGVRCGQRLLADFTSDRISTKDDATSAAIEGMRRCLRSPYLRAICAFLLLYTATSTILSLAKSGVVDAHFASRDAKRAFFANVDLYANGGTLLLQWFLTAAILRRFGVVFALLLVPLVTLFGFGVLWIAPGLWVVAGFEVVRKWANYAVTKPTREMLFTVVDQTERYPSKVFIDTFVYRVGDAFGAAVTMATLGGTLGAACAVASGLSIVWIGLGVRLGRMSGRAGAPAKR